MNFAMPFSPVISYKDLPRLLDRPKILILLFMEMNNSFRVILRDLEDNKNRINNNKTKIWIILC